MSSRVIRRRRVLFSRAGGVRVEQDNSHLAAVQELHEGELLLHLGVIILGNVHVLDFTVLGEAVFYLVDGGVARETADEERHPVVTEVSFSSSSSSSSSSKGCAV